MAKFDAAALRQRAKQNLAQTAAPAVAAKQETEQLLSGARTGNATLPIEQLHPDPEQPRRSFDRDRLDELKRAILALGGLENPVRIYWRESVGFTIKHGERRFRALSELVAEGHDELRQVPILVSPPPDRTAEGEQRLRIAQVVENNARVALLPLETAEQFHAVAISGRDEALPTRELSELTGTDERVVQRYLFVVGGLSAAEREVVREGWAEAPLRPLYALVQWLQEHAPRAADPLRETAIRRFAKARPTERMVPVVLRDLAPRKRPGRPPGKRFSAGPTKSGAFQVKLTLPPELTRDRATLRRARSDLQKAQEQLEAMERALEEEG